MNPIVSIAQGIISPIAGIFKAKEQRKQVIGTIRAQSQANEVDGKVQVTLSRAEWELASKMAESGTWKDEYITLLITSPILSIFIGTLVSAFGFGDEILTANTEALKMLKEVGVDMGDLMLYTVLAAIGIKAVR